MGGHSRLPTQDGQLTLGSQVALSDLAKEMCPGIKAGYCDLSAVVDEQTGELAYLLWSSLYAAHLPDAEAWVTAVLRDPEEVARIVIDSARRSGGESTLWRLVERCTSLRTEPATHHFSLV